VTLFYVVQHGEKELHAGDPGLTALGRQQARRTALWLREMGVRAVFSSPMRRARETADFIGSAVGVPVREDVRLRERMNWDGAQPFEEFLADWAASVRDRSFVPRSGDSSWQAGERFRAFLRDVAGEPGPVAICVHGGVTVDLLRTLLGDQALPPRLLDEGIPACAITTLEDQVVRDVASVGHLGKQHGILSALIMRLVVCRFRSGFPRQRGHSELDSGRRTLPRAVRWSPAPSEK
jgi:broad specificity phosphatase PhoE